MIRPPLELSLPGMTISHPQSERWSSVTTGTPKPLCAQACGVYEALILLSAKVRFAPNRPGNRPSVPPTARPTDRPSEDKLTPKSMNIDNMSRGNNPADRLGVHFYSRILEAEVKLSPYNIDVGRFCIKTQAQPEYLPTDRPTEPAILTFADSRIDASYALHACTQRGLEGVCSDRTSRSL